MYDDGCGDHFTIYTNIKSLCHTPEINIICQLDFHKIRE